MKKVIIGSTAIKHWYPEYQRVPNDLDYAVDVEGVKNTREIEFLYNPIITSLETGEYLRPEYLLTLKMSHLFWNINWEKHMFHVQYLLGKGVKYDVDLFYELYDFWNDYHSKNKRSDLKMSKEDFFNNAINVEIDYDYIHTLINPSPVYKKTLKEGKEVETEEDCRKFLKGLGLDNFRNVDSREDTSEFYSVIHFLDYDVYLKIEGWFDSYEQYNHSYDGIKQVFPKEVKTFIYEEK